MIGNEKMEQKIINTLRALAIDMTNAANSGHPGMPLGSAPMAMKIYEQMNINPKKPDWFNRDRFVLASGHASSLLYALLHINGFDLSINDLKDFRKFASKTPGHPEFMVTPGVDATSGPLGQGIGMAVGMALTEKILANKYNKDDHKLIDHYTFVLCGDGDLQEGVSSEASSLAGLWNLSKLIVLYDSNNITLDGSTSDTINEDTKARYEAYGWQYLKVEDGNDTKAIERAILMAKLDVTRPTIIEVKTIIGYGSVNQATNKVHGTPLGKEDGANAKKSYGISTKQFYVEEDIYHNYTNKVIKKGKLIYNSWIKDLKEYELKYPNLAKELNLIIEDKYSFNFEDLDFSNIESQATRNSSNDIINYLASICQNLIGGSADLASSNMTKIKDSKLFSSKNIQGRNINYGIREFAMGVINNGILLHKGLKVFGATFLVFSDYVKPAIKMASLMNLPSIYLFTHDSIAVGEDGPTHQPIEQLAMLRSMPNLNVIRPADAKETYGAWQLAITSKMTPTVLSLSRQNLPVLSNSDVNEVKNGAYIVYHEKNKLDLIIIATGSEVSLAIDSAIELEKDNIAVRVVSMPSVYLFEKQNLSYQNKIIPKSCKKRLVIEMSSKYGWEKYSLKTENIIAMTSYGESAPGNEVMNHFGFNVENVIKVAKRIVKK